MGSEGIQEIMGGHFEKYGIRRGTGNNGGHLGKYGIRRVREIMVGHFGKYWIRRGMGNNETGPNHLRSSLSPTKARSSTLTSQDKRQYSTSPSEYLPSQRYHAGISPPDHNHTMRRCTIGTKKISQISA